jgi:nucleobase:cation symporter-1, NCS1 family
VIVKIETRTIDFIPEAERYGAARDLFAVWFGANMNMTTVVTGALLFTLGLSLFWCAVSILVGAMVGSIFVAAHSVQGPRLGIPQMIQSRAQFGVYGAVVPMFFVMFIYFGYSVSNTLIVTQALAQETDRSRLLTIVAFSACSFLVALFGYDLIHKTQKWLTCAAIVMFGIVAFLLARDAPAAALWLPGSVEPKLVLTGIGLVATFTLSNAPYVADYSRYLPSNTSSSGVFWYTYAGMVFSNLGLMLIGAVLASRIESFVGNAGANIAHLFGHFSFAMYALIVYGLLCINVFNYYGAFMAVITTSQPFVNIRVTRTVRAFTLAMVMLGNIVFALWGEGSFADMFLSFIFIMSYALIPWTAINLVDYYIVRRGKYDVAAIFDPDGIYGRFNWIAIFAFCFSIAVEIPFISEPFYTGPIARVLGGIDLAWFVGVSVAAASYYFPMRLFASTTRHVSSGASRRSVEPLSQGGRDA